MSDKIGASLRLALAATSDSTPFYVFVKFDSGNIERAEMIEVDMLELAKQSYVTSITLEHPKPRRRKGQSSA